MMRPTRRATLVIVVSSIGALLVLRPGPAAAAPVRLTVKEAVARALESNLDLKREQLATALSDAPELMARASLEPELFVEADVARSPGNVSPQRAGLAPSSTLSVGGAAGVRKTFSTGTSVQLGLSSDALLGGGVLDPAYQSGVSLTMRQPLLRGASRAANMADISTAKIARDAAQSELRRKAELVSAETLAAYFDLHAALAQDRIQDLAVKNAETTLEQTDLLAQAGRIAGTERVAARYALQVMQRDKLRTAQTVADAQDRLARITGMVPPGSLATPDIVTVDTKPDLPDAPDLARLRDQALAQRGDYLATLDVIKAQEVQVQAARHQRLPRLDAVGSVFATGISGSATATAGGAVAGVDSGYADSYEMDQVGWSAGLVLEIPLGNAQAKGQVKAQSLALARARTDADILKQAIAEQLNRAWRSVQLALGQLELTRSAEQVAQQKVSDELERYKAGRSTAHILATVQADAVKERLAQAQAQADLNKALVTLHATAGALLPRLGLG